MKPFREAPEGYKYCSNPECTLWPATPEFFYRDKLRKGGLHPYCKSCKSVMRKRWPEDPQKNKDRANRWHEKKRRNKALAAKRMETRRRNQSKVYGKVVSE